MNTCKQTTFILLTLLLAAVPVTGSDVDVSNYYSIENIETPEAVLGRIDGLDVTPDGTLVACFHQAGRIDQYDPGTKEWSLFAAGLHDPMGVHAPSENEAVIMQRPELTRIQDTDGDGRAEDYTTLFDDFGMSGNFHELSYGPAVGPDGNYFVALSTADESEYFDEYRGAFREKGSGPSKMRSNVPYRGWVFRVTPEGTATKWASGVRSPNGIFFDDEDRLFYTDNEGDWMGTNKLFHVQKGQFYGHGASLIWKDGFNAFPWDLPLRKLDRMRTRAAVQFPYGKLNGSITQPIEDTTGGGFGPFAGQLLVGDFNNPVIWRVMLEEVAGKLQGACVPFYEGNNLKRGINRLHFGPQKDLWVSHTGRDVASWSGTTGLQRISWREKTPPAVRRMSLTDDGFELRFTRPLDREIASDPSSYSFTRFYYEYHVEYGSDRYDEQPVDVQRVEVSDDGQRVQLHLKEVKPGYLYELHLEDIRTKKGHPLVGNFVTYTVNRLRDGTRAPAQIPATRKPSDASKTSEKK